MHIDPDSIYASYALNYDSGMLKRMFDYVLSHSGLTKMEQLVIEKRYYDDKKTYRDIGEFFGVTPGRIQQIEAKSLRKLRHPSRSKELSEFNRRGDESWGDSTVSGR